MLFLNDTSIHTYKIRIGDVQKNKVLFCREINTFVKNITRKFPPICFHTIHKMRVS